MSAGAQSGTGLLSFGLTQLQEQLLVVVDRVVHVLLGLTYLINVLVIQLLPMCTNAKLVRLVLLDNTLPTVQELLLRIRARVQRVVIPLPALTGAPRDFTEMVVLVLVPQ